MYRTLCLVFFFIGFPVFSFSQVKYWVFLRDKHETSFNPIEYFDAKAIERRIVAGIPLFDSTDFPVNEKYKQTVENIAASVLQESRWFNALAVRATEKQIFQISILPFVKSIRQIEAFPVAASEGDYETFLEEDEKKLLKNQTARLQASKFEKANITGKGLRIAVFDGGFPGVNTIPVFEHIRKNKRIIQTYDFARNDSNVYGYNAHGTMVLSCIAGITDSINMGMATDAEFLLARTEISTEVFSEEENWLAAVEWADKHGANIINSSLGYTYHRYFTFEMDGSATLVTRAATMAAKKGILVINAMGNDGDTDWKILGAPADADSIISVGGINPQTDFHTSFSSFGPTADKRTKPNVVAYAHAIVAGKTKLEYAQGTSFSTPLISGFAACAWQTNRNLTNMELKSAIEQSADLYPYFDYAHGFGVPQASFFTEKEKPETHQETFSIEKSENSIDILVKPNFIEKVNADYSNYLYYHIENEKGQILKYWLIDAYQEKAATVDLNDFKEKKLTIMVHFKQYTSSFKFN